MTKHSFTDGATGGICYACAPAEGLLSSAETAALGVSARTALGIAVNPAAQMAAAGTLDNGLADGGFDGTQIGSGLGGGSLAKLAGGGGVAAMPNSWEEYSAMNSMSGSTGRAPGTIALDDPGLLAVFERYQEEFGKARSTRDASLARAILTDFSRLMRSRGSLSGLWRRDRARLPVGGTRPTKCRPALRPFHGIGP